MRFPGGQKKLAENRAGPLRFLVNLAGLLGSSGKILSNQEALRVAENAGERIAELVRHPGKHLTEGGKFFCLQQPGLKNAMSAQVAVNLDASKTPACGIHNWPHRALQHAGHRARQLYFLPHTAFGRAGQCAPAPGKLLWFSRALRQQGDQTFERCRDFRFLRREAHDLSEERVHRPDIVVGVEQYDPFLDPFQHVMKLRFEAASLPGEFVRRGRAEHHGYDIITDGHRSVDAHENSVEQFSFTSVHRIEGLVTTTRESASEPGFDVLLLPFGEKTREWASDIKPGIHNRLVLR